MKRIKTMLSLMLATSIISQYAGASENLKDHSPTLSYQVLSDNYNIAVNVFAFIKKPMSISYRNEVNCVYKDHEPIYEDGDIYTSGLKQIDLAENNEYQMTIYPIKQIGESIETLMIFMIPEKNQNELYKLDTNCCLELGEKVFKKYTIIQKIKLNEITHVKVGDNYVTVKIIELKTPKEQLWAN